MTKVELIAKIAKEARITKKQANIAINTMIDEITKALKEGSRVPLVGYGTFMTARRKPRSTLIKEIVFKPSRKLIEELNIEDEAEMHPPVRKRKG